MNFIHLKNYFLSDKVKLHFFKSFILPHFDYCISLNIYFCKTTIGYLEKLYNSCLNKLLNLRLNSLHSYDQLDCLKKFNLFPYKFRFFFRVSMFAHKITGDN